MRLISGMIKPHFVNDHKEFDQEVASVTAIMDTYVVGNSLHSLNGLKLDCKKSFLSLTTIYDSLKKELMDSATSIHKSIEPSQKIKPLKF